MKIVMGIKEGNKFVGMVLENGTNPLRFATMDEFDQLVVRGGVDGWTKDKSGVYRSCMSESVKEELKAKGLTEAEAIKAAKENFGYDMNLSLFDAMNSYSGSIKSTYAVPYNHGVLVGGIAAVMKMGMIGVNVTIVNIHIIGNPQILNQAKSWFNSIKSSRFDSWSEVAYGAASVTIDITNNDTFIKFVKQDRILINPNINKTKLNTSNGALAGLVSVTQDEKMIKSIQNLLDTVETQKEKKYGVKL